MAMASLNGGPFAIDPAAKEKDVAIEAFFEVDLVADSSALRGQWGQRAWVRFDHGAAPLISRLYRSGRQLFLGQFHV
jgi:putative peptide zinc metalloprotease protein